MASPYTEVDELRGRIDAHRPFTPDLVERMQRWLLPQFIWASDGLGARDRLTLAEVTAFLEREVVSGGHHLDRFLGVERHEQAFELTERRAREGGRADLPFIRLLHSTLTEGARGDVEHRPGEWKESESPETRRRGRRFRYARPSDVPALMTRLIEELARLSQTEHPVRVATWLYYHLHLIHPFQTHNGQVARLAASCVLLHHGYPPLIIDPRDLGPYLDALAACDATVPGGVEPLSPRSDVTPLELVFCEGLRRVAARLLDFIEGREVHASDLPRRVVDDQEQLLASMLAQQDLSWRVRGSADVRALHGRLERLLRQLECKGPIYSIRVEDADVVPTHGVWREFSPALPAGDAGIVGRISLVISGEPTSNLRYPVSPRLRLVVVGTQTTAQVILQWDDQARPKANPGPPRAEQWPDAALDKLLTRAIDARRRAFEFRVLEENLSAAAQEEIKKLLQEQPGRQSMRLRRITTRRGPSARLGKVSGVLAVPPEQPNDPDATQVFEPPPTTPSGPRSPTARLDGLRPTEPPLSF
jgi:hypothetical protein